MSNEPKLDLRRLRIFGLILGGLLAFFGWRWLRNGWTPAAGLLAAGALCAALALVKPAWLEPLERRWMRAARVVSRIVTVALLTALYYLVITPYGLFLGLFMKDQLDRALERSATSYWKPRPPGGGAETYERQF